MGAGAEGLAGSLFASVGSMGSLEMGAVVPEVFTGSISSRSARPPRSLESSEPEVKALPFLGAGAGASSGAGAGAGAGTGAEAGTGARGGAGWASLSSSLLPS